MPANTISVSLSREFIEGFSPFRDISKSKAKPVTKQLKCGPVEKRQCRQSADAESAESVENAALTGHTTGHALCREATGERGLPWLVHGAIENTMTLASMARLRGARAMALRSPVAEAHRSLDDL